MLYSGECSDQREHGTRVRNQEWAKGQRSARELVPGARWMVGAVDVTSVASLQEGL